MLAIFLDTESTGLDPQIHNVIEIAFKVIDVLTGHCLASYQSIVSQTPEVWQNKDPQSIEINGFTWEEVIKGKEPTLIGLEIIAILTSLQIERGKSVFICQNPSFDRSFFAQLISVYTQEKLRWPYHWLDFASMFWALRMQESLKGGQPFPKEINLSKNDIANRYNLPPEAHPHRAMNGVDHLILCYQTVIGFNHKNTLIAD
jgi:DNA polymerase-3 subunit epsilon/oligoribonuclease